MMKTITLEDMKIKHHSLFKSFKGERIDWDHIRNDSDEPSYYIPEDQSSYERICSYQLNEENFKEINDLMAELKSTKIFSVGSGRSCLEYNLAKLNIDVIVSDKSNTIKRLKKLKINLHGPFSADTIFINDYKKFDVIVGMYHDQVLSPFKALFQYDAINMTLGLSYLRVSPDHGIASNLIKKNKASSESLQKCFDFFKNL